MVENMAQVRIPESELEWKFVRSGGPGGQNVNKVASKAVLRWNMAGSAVLSEEAKAHLATRLRARLTAEGDLIITSQRFRDQERNRRDCLAKLVALVQQAMRRPKARKATRPTRGSKEARLEAKRRRALRKSQRRVVGDG
jgi:ribosome-associated protein